MLTRFMIAVVLALSGLATPPALAQSSANRVVYVCRYNDLKTPDGRSAVAETRPFAVPDGVTGEQVQNDWMAWYGAQNPHLRMSSYTAYCNGTVEVGLKYVQHLINQYEKWTIVRSEWIPSYAVPYALPKELYYYCVAPEQGLQRRLFTDLFKAPMPERIDAYMEKANQAHAVWLRSIGYNYYTTNMGCSPTFPEAFQHYASMLDGAARITDPSRPFTLGRSAWPGVDPKAAPNLIDDLVARAEYAKKRIMGAVQTAKTAPPPAPKPKPAAAAPASAGSLTVKTDTSLRDAGKAWDEQVKKALAEEAKKKVELAAKTAQANAKAKADLEAFLKARRKQGSAQ
jgi:hypothetical protein